MAIVIKPAFQSTIADDPADLAAGYLTPSRWNAAMSITGLTANALLLSDGTDLTQSANFTASDTLMNSGPAIRIGTGTNGLWMGHSQNGYGALYAPDVTPSTTNFFIRGGSNQTSIAASGTIYFLDQDNNIKAQFVIASGSFETLGYLSMNEMTAPAGAANSARVFAQDNGAGKTQLMVIFGSGVAQQLAIEA